MNYRDPHANSLYIIRYAGESRLLLINGAPSGPNPMYMIAVKCCYSLFQGSKLL